MNKLVWPAKDPSDVLDYAIAWSLAEGETILSSDWVVTGGLIQGASSVSGSSTIVWLSGGDLGPATAQNTITTSDGRTYERSVTINVVDL